MAASVDIMLLLLSMQPSRPNQPHTRKTATSPRLHKPGSAGVDTTLAGMVLQIGGIGVSTHFLRQIKGLYYARRNRSRFPGS